MNVGKLLETIETILALDTSHNVQSLLDQLRDHLNHLSNSPQDATLQQQFHNGLIHMERALDAMQKSISPAERHRLEEINAAKFFLSPISREVRVLIQENPITPSVVARVLDQLAGERQNYINRITTLRDHLKIIGVSEEIHLDGEAEIGFFLPRTLFENSFPNLIKELSEIQRILRLYMEIATGSVEDAQVREISSSDPMFFLGVPAATAILVGRSIKWAIGIWKSVEEVRLLRTQVEAAQIMNDRDRLELVEKFDTVMKKTVDIGVKDHSADLISGSKILDIGRQKEISGPLDRILGSILARVERGMTVEIKRIDRPSDRSTDQENSDQTPSEREFSDLQNDLVFPPPAKTPILQLDSYHSPDGDQA